MQPHNLQHAVSYYMPVQHGGQMYVPSGNPNHVRGQLVFAQPQQGVPMYAPTATHLPVVGIQGPAGFISASAQPSYERILVEDPSTIVMNTAYSYPQAQQTLYPAVQTGQPLQPLPRPPSLRQPSALPPPPADERMQRQLIVNYLSPHVSSADLHQLFAQFGPLDGARVIYDRASGLTRGYGFVYFKNAEDAQRSIETMNGFELHGKWLKVGYSTNPVSGRPA